MRWTSISLALAAMMVPRVGRSQPAPTPASPSTPATGGTNGEAPPIAPSPAPATARAESGAEASAQPPLNIEAITGAHPPPTNIVYFQYGVAFAAEMVSAHGPICNAAGVPCILGPGGGIAIRAGFRGAGPIYLGVAYEVTKQDPSKLYRLALLQQARAEGRYYLMTARITEPYASVSLGAAGYGNEWGVDTWGPAGSVGFGLEYQVTQRTVVGVAANYRILYFSRFTDTSGASRDPGISQLVGIDFILEQRDPSFVTDKTAKKAD